MFSCRYQELQPLLPVKGTGSYMPLPKGRFGCVCLKTDNACSILSGFFFFNSPFKNHGLDFLICSQQKKKKEKIVHFEASFVRAALPRAFLASGATENAALERMEDSLGRLGGGIPRLLVKGRTWHCREVTEKIVHVLFETFDKDRIRLKRTKAEGESISRAENGSRRCLSSG